MSTALSDEDLPPILRERAKYSQERLETLRERLHECSQAGNLPPDLAVFCAGSYARLEASEYSDIDVFFVYGSGAEEGSDRRTREIRLFGSLIQISESLDFPPFSGDSEYLSTRKTEEILEHLGAREDDYYNHFTLRMLMLLESQCLLNDDTFEKVKTECLSSYYRDYPGHEASFEPWFLVNDITRFWKTLLLNYEHRRNKGDHDDEKRRKQKVRNLKLKFSRMTTCFATVAALASFPSSAVGTVELADVLELTKQTPQQRLMSVIVRHPVLRREVNNLIKQYAWFLEQTGKSEDDLLEMFKDEASVSDAFQKARSYGEAMFNLLARIEEVGDRPLLRYLVI